MKILKAFIYAIVLAAVTVAFKPEASHAETAWYEYGDLWVEFDAKTGTITWFDHGDNADVTSVTVPAEIGGATVKHIGDKAFANISKLKTITIPDSVVSIGNWAFYNCESLTGVDCSKSVKTIGEGAFKNCESLKKVTLRASSVNLQSEAFYGCSGLSKFVAKGSLLIGDKAFFRCYKLATVQAKKGITFIGDMAFYECTKLMKLTAVTELDYLGDEAFYGCTRYKGEKKLEAAVKNKRSASVTASASKVSYSKLKKKSRTVTVTVAGSKGTVKYTNKCPDSLKDYITISKNGVITFKKGAPKGTYKVKVTVAAKGMYKKTTKTLKIKVK